MSEVKISDDEAFEPSKKKDKKKVLKTIGIIAIVIVILLIILNIKNIVGLFYPSVMGATVGNTFNGGCAVKDGKYIYYIGPDDQMETSVIYKSKIGDDGSIEPIYIGAYDVRCLNLINNKLYFLVIELNNEPSDLGEYSYNKKICRMDLDGSNFEEIKVNGISDNNIYFYTVKNKIYYVGEDENVYTMNLDGSNNKLYLDTQNGMMSINEEYIIYTPDNEKVMIKKLKNKNNEIVLSDELIYSPQISGDTVYFVNAEQQLSKISVNGGDVEKLLDDQSYNIIVSGNYIYYLNYKDIENEDYTIVMYKYDIENKSVEVVKEFNYMTFVNVLDGLVYYMDVVDEKAFVSLLDTNNANTEKILKEWDYSLLEGNEAEDGSTGETQSVENVSVTDAVVTEEFEMPVSEAEMTEMTENVVEAIGEFVTE